MATERMTATAWTEEEDPRRLLEHAAPRICHRHLSLVQLELAERAWSFGRAQRRSDARVTAVAGQTDHLIGRVRAWCFFRISDEALREATMALDAARPLAIAPAFDRLDPGVIGVLAVVRAAAFASCARLSGREEDVPFGAPLYAPVLAALRVLGGGAGVGDAATFLARLIRKRIPYPTTENTVWVASPGIVFAGEFVLRIDGQRIGDAVPRAEFPGLTGARAVAFDEAQQNAVAECAAQARDRASAAPRLEERLRQLEAERAEREAEAARRRQLAAAEAQAAEERAAAERVRALAAEAERLQRWREAASREAARRGVDPAKERAARGPSLADRLGSVASSAVVYGVQLAVVAALLIPESDPEPEWERGSPAAWADEEPTPFDDEPSFVEDEPEEERVDDQEDEAVDDEEDEVADEDELEADDEWSRPSRESRYGARDALEDEQEWEEQQLAREAQRREAERAREAEEEAARAEWARRLEEVHFELEDRVSAADPRGAGELDERLGLGRFAIDERLGLGRSAFDDDPFAP